MGTFKDSLKKWFYHEDSNAAERGTRVCLMDASGNPLGSGELVRTISYAPCKDDFVDMGLPSGTLWAKKNLGAVSETDYGMYASWGNLELHPEGDGYDFSQATYNASPAASISTNLTLEQDIAHTTLGMGWKMPTLQQFQELINNTTNSWVTNYKGVSGLNGRLLTATNGNTLFFPAAGYYEGDALRELNTNSAYWSKSLYSNVDAYYFASAANSFVANAHYNRRCGFSIRPIL